MKITPWYLAALAPFAAIGWSGAYLGHVVVVVLTIGIFCGTLSLGRSNNSPEHRQAKGSSREDLQHRVTLLGAFIGGNRSAPRRS